MTRFEKELNGLLVTIYRSMETLEEKMLRASRAVPLSFSEVHTLEAVAAGGTAGVTVSAVSEYLDIRLPSATAAVNRLVKKGFLAKQRENTDGRVVQVRLTRAGRRAESAHRFFHRNMVRAAIQDLTEEERAAMLKGVSKLNTWLEVNIAAYNGDP